MNVSQEHLVASEGRHGVSSCVLANLSFWCRSLLTVPGIAGQGLEPLLMFRHLPPSSALAHPSKG